MKIISITSNNLYGIFEEIQTQLGGKLDKNSKEYRLEINNETGQGFISGIIIEPAICYIEYEINFQEDISFVFKQDNSNSIHFGYCSDGCFNQSFGEEGKRNRLNQFQTGIFSNSSNKKNTIFSFNKNQPSKVSLITVATSSINDQEFKQQLINTFINSTGNNPFSYVGSLNIRIAEKINILNSINQKGLVRNLLINSTVYLILALEIEQHKNDITKAGNNSNILSQSDLEIIKRVSEYITMNPEIQYSLKYLCEKFALSPFKLQEGFKIMHNRTVTDFIRNTRVEAAENLIRTSELNISEIVYTVGLTSRSYFSKIFKEKYNCSPKHYQNHQNKVVITA